MAHPADPSIPVIDLSRFRTADPAQRQQVAHDMLAACRDVGFVYLTHHAVPPPLVAEAFQWSARFFALPAADKARAPHPPEGWWHRGYSGVGREQVAAGVPDVKESFDIGREDNAALPNVWLPEAVLPGFRAFWVAFYDACYAAEVEVLRLLALALGLEEGLLVEYHRERDNQIRLLHYPPVEEAVVRRGAKERIAAHTDFGTMTMLFQDDVGGLEVEHPTAPGRFVAVPPVAGAVVLNLGDFMQRWSNDGLKSTRHRVRAPPRDTDGAGTMLRARYSIPYFVGADVHKTIECLPGSYGLGRPKRYGPINAEQYINERLNAIR